MELTQRSVMGVGIAMLMALGLVAASAALVPDTGFRVPTDPVEVVAQLATGQVYSATLRTALQAQRAAPADMALALTAARTLIDEGRDKGDSRLVGAALPILQPFMAAPQAMYLAATARQYQHDFPGALALLDRVLAIDPRDVNALLNRATIRTVLGQYDLALQDCAAITALPRADVGFLCAASAQTLTVEAPGYAARLTQIVAQPGVLDPALMPWATSLLGELALLQGDVARAETHLARVVADDPTALRDMLMLADILLAQNREAQVLTLLDRAPDTDGILIRRILAGAGDANTLRDTLATRAQRSLDLGLAAHAREEALFYLRIANDPTRALERAQANWALQHEFDDAQLLLDAADAAGQPGAANPVMKWMAQWAISIPALRISANVKATGP
jgi:tetratricopeptide (TPR) repeat protein